MTLLLKPHTVTVYAPAQAVDGATKQVAAMQHSGTGQSVICKVEPLDAETAFGMYGVEAREPRRLMCELADEAKMVTNARVVYDSQNFRVRAVKRFGAYTETAHLTCLLSKEE